MTNGVINGVMNDDEGQPVIQRSMAGAGTAAFSSRTISRTRSSVHRGRDEPRTAPSRSPASAGDLGDLQHRIVRQQHAAGPQHRRDRSSRRRRVGCAGRSPVILQHRAQAHLVCRGAPALRRHVRSGRRHASSTPSPRCSRADRNSRAAPDDKRRAGRWGAEPLCADGR